jgi:hypothetical protein
MGLTPAGQLEGLTRTALMAHRENDAARLRAEWKADKEREKLMAMPKETVHLGGELPYPGAKLQVCVSAAGYFLGYIDKDGLPWSRESHYFKVVGAASRALASGDWERR